MEPPPDNPRLERTKSVVVTPNDAWLRPKPPRETYREAPLVRSASGGALDRKDKAAYFEEKRQWAKSQQEKFKYEDIIEDPDRPVAPLRDRPVKPGPYFEYELMRNQRVVHELDGVNYYVGGFKPHKARWWDEKFVRLLGTNPMHEPGRKIVRFSEKRLLKFDWASTWRGTILSSSFIWTQLILVYLVGAITFLVAYFVQISSSGRFSEIHKNGGTDDLVEVLEIFDELQEIATISESLTLLVAFVLGLYVTKQVDIYWNIRQKFLQGVLNSVQSICIRMAIYFPSNNREDVDARETVLRYGLLSIALLFKDAAEADVWTVRQRKIAGVHDLSDLVRDGLLTNQEANLLENCPAKSQVVWVWIASFFTKMCLDGRLPDPLKNQEAILKECTKANCNVAFVIGRINTQYPLTYSHLVILMVKVLIFLTAIQAGYITAVSIIFGYSYWAVTQIILLTVLTIFHQGLIDIKEHITNPFRKNSTDFSWKIFHSRLCNECKAIFDAGATPPYTKPERPKPAVLPAQLIETRRMLPQGRDIGGGRRASKLSSRAVETGCRISSICRTMRAPLASLGMAGDRTFSFFRLLVRILWLIAVGGGTHVLPCRASQICNEDPTLVISELRLLPASTSNPGFVELFNPLPVEVCLDAIEVRVERKAEQNGEFRTTYRFDDCRMCNSEGKGCCETLAPFSFRVIEQQGNGIFETPCSLSMLPEWSSPPTSVYLTNKTDGSTLDFTIVPTELPLHWSWARPGDDKFECPGLFEPTSHPTPQSFNTFEALSLKKTDVERQATAVLNNFSEEEIHSLLHCNKGKVVPEQLEKGYYTKGKYFTGIWGKGYYLKDVYHPRFEFKEYRPGYCTWVGDPRQEKAKFFRKPYIRCQRGEWSQARFRDGYYREDIEPPFWIRGGVFAVGYYVPQNVTMPKYIPSKCEAKQVLEVGQLKVPPTGSGITPYTFLCIWYKLPTPCNVVANRATITPTGVYIRDDALAPAPQGADMQEVSFPGSGA